MNDDAPVLRADLGDGVVLLTLNRPGARNALSTPLLAALAAYLAQADADPATRAVVLTGGPKLFAAGADITELAAHDPDSIKTDPRRAHWLAVWAFEKPLIGAVNGWCLGGGCELAMSCDILIAGADARFGQPEINLGLIPGSGGTQRLIRAIGKSRAAQMVLAGDFIGAKEAHERGLVSEIAPPELTEERAVAVARAIAAKPPLAAKAAKAALNAAFEGPLTQGLAFERARFVDLFATEDKAEGLAAFLEKRKPRFKGR